MASEMTTAEMVTGLRRLADICTRDDEAVLLGEVLKARGV